MISLRRNDKIIIVVGVVILLAAGAGVALYSPSKVETPTQSATTLTSYTVKWQEKTGSLSSISKFASKGTPYSVNVTIDQTNLKSISFQLTWVDNKALLKRFGLDTLALDVTTPMGTTVSGSMQSQKKTKAGNFTVNITVSDTQPKVKTVQANNSNEAIQRLKAELQKADLWAGKTINATVTVTIGEHFPLRFRDKGNSFTLAVDYTYYTFTLGNTTKTGSDDVPGDFPPTDTGDSWTPPYMSMIINTGCGRYV